MRAPDDAWIVYSPERRYAEAFRGTPADNSEERALRILRPRIGPVKMKDFADALWLQFIAYLHGEQRRVTLRLGPATGPAKCKPRHTPHR